MIIVYSENFYKPQNFKWEGVYRQLQEGDFLIEIPKLNINQEGVASISVYGKKRDEDEGLNYGNIEVVEVKCKCLQDSPLYYGSQDGIKYLYSVKFYLYSINGEYKICSLECDDLFFLLLTILPYLNLLLKENHNISEFDFEWINWQCTTWEFCQANGQGRSFSQCDNDIYSLESLYDYIDTITIDGTYYSISSRGGGCCFTELDIKYHYIDKYLSLLIGEALKSKPIFSDTNVSYKVRVDREDFEGYCSTMENKIDNIKLEYYKNEILKKIRIHTLRNFDFTAMRKMRFLKKH